MFSNSQNSAFMQLIAYVMNHFCTFFPTSLPGPSLQQWAASWGVSTTPTGSQHDGYLQRHSFLFILCTIFPLPHMLFRIFPMRSIKRFFSQCVQRFFSSRDVFLDPPVYFENLVTILTALCLTLIAVVLTNFRNFLTFWIIFQGIRPTVNDADINASLAFLAPFAADWARATWFLSEQPLLDCNTHPHFSKSPFFEIPIFLRKKVHKKWKSTFFLGFQQNPLCANSSNSNSHTILHKIDFEKFKDFLTRQKFRRKPRTCDNRSDAQGKGTTLERMPTWEPSEIISKDLCVPTVFPFGVSLWWTWDNDRVRHPSDFINRDVRSFEKDCPVSPVNPSPTTFRVIVRVK